MYPCLQLYIHQLVENSIWQNPQKSEMKEMLLKNIYFSWFCSLRLRKNRAKGPFDLSEFPAKHLICTPVDCLFGFLSLVELNMPWVLPVQTSGNFSQNVMVAPCKQLLLVWSRQKDLVGTETHCFAFLSVWIAYDPFYNISRNL